MERIELIEEKIRAWLGQMGLPVTTGPGGIITLKSDRSLLFISLASGDRRPWVRITAIALVGFTPSLDFLHRVLELNNEVAFGGFRLFEDRTLAFSTTLQPDALDADGFADATRYVAYVADTWAPELRALAGGRYSVELTRDLDEGRGTT
jgi:hypothetical protein